MTYAGQPLERGSVGVVFQRPILYPHLSVKDNILFPTRLGAFSGGVDMDYYRELLDALKLEGLESRKPSQLSGGQAQRVAIARSQVNGAPVTFADEPTGALDSKTAREVMALLLTMIPQQGKTLLVVTHDPNVAAACSRVVYLQDGQIVSDQRNNQGGVPASQNHAQSFGAQSQAGA